MGWLFVEEGMCEVSGEFKGGRQEFDTVACVHCGGVIKIVISGVTKAKDTKYRCEHCDGPVCKYCAPKMEKDGCNPLKKQIDQAVDQMARAKPGMVRRIQTTPQRRRRSI